MRGDVSVVSRKTKRVVSVHFSHTCSAADEHDLFSPSTGVIQSNNVNSPAVELNAVVRDGISNAATSSHLENYGLIKGAGVAVLGGAGQETVVNHGHIVGDVVLGDGADTFVAGKGGILAGNLYLGGGADLVRIENESGITHIADFVASGASHDQIDVSKFFSSFSDLNANSKQISNDVAITLDHDHDQVVLENVHLSGLNSGDFLFA